jgi:hypothetical protein
VSEDPALKLLVARLSQAEARGLLIDVLGRSARRSSGVRVLLAVDALRACAADGERPSSPRAYARWREQQPSPTELPSARFIGRCFEQRWGAALVAAELPISAGRQAQQRNASTRGYSDAELIAALRSWFENARPDHPTFRAYATWARTRLAADPDVRLPLSAPTFRAAFGSWQRAVEFAAGTSDRARRGRDVRSNYEDQQMRAHLAAAAAATGMSSALTRRAYDRWSETAVTNSGIRPAHSETIRRRFGSWTAALTAAGLDRSPS